MKGCIDSIPVCFLAAVLTSLLWPVWDGNVAPAVAQQNMPGSQQRVQELGGLRFYEIGDLLAVENSDGDDLINLITITVTVTEWEEVGGPASIELDRYRLIVLHTVEGHRELAKCLKELRIAIQKQDK